MEPTADSSAVSPALSARLEAARQELLDLGLRNPLLNYRPSPARGVTVVREESAAVYEVLVRQGKTMYFQAAPEPRKPKATSAKTAASDTQAATEAESPEPGGAAEPALSRPASLLTSGSPLSTGEGREASGGWENEASGAVVPESISSRVPDALLTDNKLQTDEPLAKLESRLLNTYYTARTSLEEQGVNILYLALGQLVWYEADSSQEPRRAPLVLVPVLLERGSAAERFKLRYTGAEVEANLSLQARLKTSFGLLLPELDEDAGVAAYLAAVAQAVAGLPRWQVEADSIALGFFSFGKFMLYRDLDAATWPQDTLRTHPAIEALLGPETGFRDPAPSLGDATFLDAETRTHELHQVLDADSSQLLALLAVHEGRNLVIQGPPGTGKSQTIANLLAEAIGAGKRVLFVAEKMAALEVVKRRLDALGLGAACLELHSHKANKKALHEELKTTLGLGRPATVTLVDDQVAQLPRYRQALNDYALAVNAPLGRSRRSVQQVTGELLALREQVGAAELPRIAFAQLPTWTDADAARAEDLATRLQATLRKIGPPKQLLFWGSELTVLLPAEQDQLAALLREAEAAVTTLQTAAETLAATLRQSAPADRHAAEALLPLARHAQLAPDLAAAAVTDAAWARQGSQLLDALTAGAAEAALRQQYEPQLLPEAWTEQFLPERAALLSYGNKWWKFLSGSYRRARQRLQSLWRTPLPADNAPLIAAIDAIHEAARHAQTLQQAEPLARQLFGPAWQGPRSDWTALRRVADYLSLTHQRVAQGQLPATVLSYLAEAAGNDATTQSRRATIIADVEQLKGLGQPLNAQLTTLETALARHRAALQAVADALRLNEARRFGPEGRLQLQPFVQQTATLIGWSSNLPALHQAVEWNNAAAAAQAENLPELLLLAENWPEAAQHLAAATRRTWLEYLQRLAYEQHPALRQFERAAHEETTARFRQADRAVLHHHRIRALRQHHEQLPNPQAGGQMLVLSREFAKKARHLPLRRLMEQAGRAVQAIKPVFMMSPLSVASFLPPGAVEFDLVVFDEASQVKPVDALGAIARGRQLVVVGDSKQLPPTSFFDSLTGGGEEADEDNVTADIQSILELCRARQMPERMLRWHYRSLHQSLIAASNHLYYHDGLVIFPSPGGLNGTEQLGLVYHHLPDTYYERGTTRTNPLEARAVAEAVLHHARTTPRLTLGVVAFSMAQRQAIEDALEQLRRQHPETEDFFNRHPHEPFFIKNLENVQGDERDVILISIGYGRTREGYLPMSFGPLNGAGGERRLNVLITRAKQRCEVFTNLSADDLDLTRSRAQGVADLKTFLYFAQHGRLRQDEDTGRPMDSPFEEAVYRALTARGYQLRPQIGSQGFFIDLAVVDPDQPGRYVLGIECDGAMYHSARSARDRDRLRQQVLEAVGWRLHRIWSTDWFRDPAAETERAVQAIEQARRLAAQEQSEDEEPAVAPAATVDIEREDAPLAAATPAEPYQLAQLPPAVGHRELHQHSLGQLANWLTQVVRVESPVHLDEATRRLAQASGAAQVGARMRKTVRDAALLATNLRHLRQQGDFLWENSMQQPPLRDRSQLPAISRKLPLVAPEELARALRTTVADSFALPRDAAYLATIRLLGFARLSDDMREQLDGVLAGLLERGELAEAAGVLRPVE